LRVVKSEEHKISDTGKWRRFTLGSERFLHFILQKFYKHF